jgi:hypothetical protein
MTLSILLLIQWIDNQGKNKESNSDYMNRHIMLNLFTDKALALMSQYEDKDKSELVRDLCENIFRRIRGKGKGNS